MKKEFNPFFSPSSSTSKEQKKCSMSEIFYGNDEINDDINILLGNKEREQKEYTDNILGELNKVKTKNKYHHNLKLMVNFIIFIIDNIKPKLNSIPKTAKYIIKTTKDFKEKKRIEGVFTDVNGRFIYTLNILSEIDITLEVYHRFLSYINLSYLKNKKTKKSNVIRLFYEQAMNAYDSTLMSIYTDLGFDFKQDELYNIDAFFERENPTKLQKLYDYTLGRIITSKNKEDRMFKFAFERFYYLIVYIDDIYSKILPHLAYMQSYISRIELLIGNTKCDFKKITTYEKPLKTLLFKLLETLKKYESFNKELLKLIDDKKTSTKLKRYIERILTVEI